MPAGTIYLFLGLMTGTIFACQGAINGRLAAHIGGPTLAALVSFSIGWTVLLLINLALRPAIAGAAGFAAAPWWAYLGGVIGAIGVSSAAFSVPNIGVATWVACVITGQLFCALLLDQVGAFGQTVRDITPLRILGVAFLFAGVYLIRRA